MTDFALVCDEPAVADAVLSAAAAAGVDMTDDAERTRCVLACASAAPRARARCGPDADLWVLGFDAVRVAAAGMRVDARVIVLPEGSRRLAELFVGASRATFLHVLGGAGGVGASTLAAGLAGAAAREGRSVALVELDPLGGGLDLLLGAERCPGWRWDALQGARGELGDLRAHLPEHGGVTVVSLARSDRQPPGEEAARAVLESLGRSVDVVVCDLGRGGPLVDVARRTGRTVVLAEPRVMGVAAAERLTRPGDAVVVRGGRVGSLAAADVGDALGLPVLGVLPEDARLAEGAEQGVSPWQAARRAWRRAVAGVYVELVGQP